MVKTVRDPESEPGKIMVRVTRRLTDAKLLTVAPGKEGVDKVESDERGENE